MIGKSLNIITIRSALNHVQTHLPIGDSKWHTILTSMLYYKSVDNENGHLFSPAFSQSKWPHFNIS